MNVGGYPLQNPLQDNLYRRPDLGQLRRSTLNRQPYGFRQAPMDPPGPTLYDDEVIVTLAHRSFSPILPQTAIPSVNVPWWNGRRLVFRHA